VEAILWYQEKREEGKAKPYAEIVRDECVECSVCFKANVCPTDAIRNEDLEWPRVLRRAFSDPFYEHKGTYVPGRGTEEIKTNEVTGRFRDGYIGVGLEFGRPGVGVRLGETEEALKRFVQMGLKLEPLNPLTQLIENPKTGELKKDVLNEKVLSAIVEFIAPVEKAPEIFKAIQEIGSEIQTVFSLDLISKVSLDGTIPIVREAEKAGIQRSVNGKVNVGLGRPLFHP
jgi:ferredoxin